MLVQPAPNSPATLTSSVRGDTLSRSRPAGQGWRLQGLTNSAGTNNMSNNWSAAVSARDGSFSVPIVTNNPPVFYRLVYPSSACDGIELTRARRPAQADVLARLSLMCDEVA